MNTNLIHNILNTVIVVIPALEALDFTTFVGPEKALVIVAVLGMAKIAINLVRDGFFGLAKEQPPVV